MADVGWVRRYEPTPPREAWNYQRPSSPCPASKSAGRSLVDTSSPCPASKSGGRSLVDTSSPCPASKSAGRSLVYTRVVPDISPAGYTAFFDIRYPAGYPARKTI